MDKNILEFVAFCIGKLAVVLKLLQREIYRRLKVFGSWTNTLYLHTMYYTLLVLVILWKTLWTT